jgi:uncharacterized phage protein (TIGR02220 family)
MAKSPAFQLYAADFYMDTNSWTIAEVGAYVRLLLAEWVNGPLPYAMSDLSRIAGISDPRTMYKMWSRTLGKKFITTDGNLLINKRLEEVRENQRKYFESQSQKGISGNRKRWKDHIARAIPVQSPDDRSSSSSSSSINNKEKNILSCKHDSIPFSEIISYLNQRTGKNFSPKARESKQHIRARWNEGRRLDDFKKVVDIKWEKWGTDEKMVDYLRPQTLFGTKMESYLQEESYGSGDSNALERIRKAKERDIEAGRIVETPGQTPSSD